MGTHTYGPGTTQGWFARRNNQAILLSILLVLATLILYYPAHNHPFANIDDSGYISENPHVAAGLNWDTITWALTTYDDSNWHPVTWLSLALDCQIFGVNAGLHHDVNVLIHAMNAALLLWVLLLATGYIGRSFMVAALFALHPINVESVAWIAERKNVLSMTFLLLALGAYRWYAQKPGWLRYSVVAVLFAIGLMTKPQIIMLPVAFLLWDYWPLRRMFATVPGTANGTRTDEAVPPRKFAWLLEEKMPLLGLCAASALLTVLAQRVGSPKNWQYTLPTRIANAIVAYARYVGKAVWPSKLALMYLHPGNSIKGWQVAVALVFLLSVTAWVLMAWKHRYLLVGWFWFLVLMVPTVGLLQVGRQAMADRYAYHTFIGLFIMFCWGGADLARQLHVGKALLTAVSLSILAVLSVVARRQLNYWSDNLTLWSHALQVTDNNWVAEDLVGELLAGKGKTEQAMPHFYRAAEIVPEDPVSNLPIAIYEHRRGNLPEALKHYVQVTKSGEVTTDQKAKAYAGEGYTYREMGDYTRSRENLQMAVALNPKDPEMWIFLGVAAYKTGNASEAVQAYQHGLAIRSVDWGYLLLARAFEQNGQKEQAQQATERARQISKNFAEAQKAAEGVLAAPAAAP